ncbi:MULTISPECIES: PTS glucitol/sorbitol transporter subunit IIA [unclassified Halanaerobium]|uniref:PTS glucitol/sorbitol transporter subunit IIA n=1 Tax=unclassified Halanaerobium TaxID=2641197 RepID=UPI000DF24877|nr:MULTISPECIES: PTS glucitol/sorbitol transporter subunit IIA [unclassified Halanaerobium]RCW47358.1 PTS system glucitol/sorbitol-specific IIA component [Halanaerobium sp. MA284_MarDTE_T2]RCW84897.1 PTS system glucitol/sorbitol-specific IIA component [Halanaerobium sp. DL-01]
METIYEVEVTGLGEGVDEFLEQDLIVLFNNNAPAELAEISVIHTEAELKGEIEAGDIISIDDNDYKITAVGEVVNKNISRLGHSTLRFNGRDEAQLPGDINVEKSPLPDIKKGTIIKIIKK